MRRARNPLHVHSSHDPHNRSTKRKSVYSPTRSGSFVLRKSEDKHEADWNLFPGGELQLPDDRLRKDEGNHIANGVQNRSRVFQRITRLTCICQAPTLGEWCALKAIGKIKTNGPECYPSGHEVYAYSKDATMNLKDAQDQSQDG